ncbi:TonB-dependent receptor domain-containing protein [Bradyrhizobium sp.]|uniref:TonB-dependent receptor domain-containing protein n=1 Tax=Bradyrhizobium sp. TaxID=376 RepID=UPI0039E66AFB
MESRGAAEDGHRDVTSDGRRRLLSLWLATTILSCGACTLALSPSFAQQAVRSASADQAINFSIPAQSLPSAINSFISATGWQISYSSALARGKTSTAVSGVMNPAQALYQLVAGTGVQVMIGAAGSAALVDSTNVSMNQAPPSDGSLLLDTIEVKGSGGESSVYTPYETPGATSHISSDDIDHYRGSSPSDIFRGTPGVMSGDSRNSGGAIDVNIRGLQGQGRVKVSVDDAENAVTVYHGYQGQSNRTYIDPDLIAGIDINKGLDVASRGAAGSVNMRTIGANDIVKPGDTWGIRVKGGFGTNTTAPTPGASGGYLWPTTSRPGLTESATGLDRPGFLNPTSGSGSFAGAVKQDNWDFMTAYAWRKQGNYFAGKNGGEGVYANPVLNSSGTYVNGGFTNYRRGEEVLNTQLETQSFLAKANFRFDDGQSLQVSYNNYRGEGGYWAPYAGAMVDMSQTKYGATTGTKIDTGTARYRWKPDNNDLVDLKATAWLTYFQLLNDGRLTTNPNSSTSFTKPWPAEIGLAEDYRTGTNTLMWGNDLSNQSKFSFDRFGDLDLTYGLSWLSQQVGLNRYAEYYSYILPSAGTRDEAGTFAKAAYKPVQWLTLNGGLRWAKFSADGATQRLFGATETATPIESGPPRGAEGYSPSAGIVVEPVKGTQFYVNYSSALRLPSLMETIGTFTIVEKGLKPERLNSWDAGVNVNRESLLAKGDSARLKLGWFDWHVKDYISRATQEVQQGTALRIHNIFGASFNGYELSTRYEIAGFAADFAANYYTKVEYCVTEDTCGNMSLYGDYATNHVPPKYTLDLKLSQKLFDDKLTVGGRAYHVGPRAAAHGDVTAQGYSAFITQIQWKPYTLVDVFADYKIDDNYTASVRVENLTDQFYIDPLGLLPQPGPGRTFYASLTGRFGGDQALPRWSPPSRASSGARNPSTDWSGFYAGVHTGFGKAHTQGSSSVLNPNADNFGGLADGIAASEAANLKFSGGQLGLQAGYNWQFANRFVLGIEADIGKAWIAGHQDNSAQDDALLAAAGWIQSRTHHDIDWTASVRGKLGYAFNNGLMLYGTAGVALLRENVARDQYWVYSRGYDQVAGADNFVHYVDQVAATRIGATMGVGGEYALNDHWSVKSDYTYSRFGSKDYAFEHATAGAGPDYLTRERTGTNPLGQPIYKYTDHTGGNTIVNGRRASNTFGLHSMKVGLNYRF